MTVDASDHPNDRFGYSVYAGVLLASPAQQCAVQELREKIKPGRAILPAHVTVKGTFCDISSLDEVERLFEVVAARHSPLTVRFESTHVNVIKDASVLDVVKAPQLVRIYDELRTTLGSVGTDAYGYDTQGYAPHLTLWQECPPENAALAARLGREIKLGEGFTAAEVTLVGRIGPAHGGRWTTLRAFKLGLAG